MNRYGGEEDEDNTGLQRVESEDQTIIDDVDGDVSNSGDTDNEMLLHLSKLHNNTQFSLPKTLSKGVLYMIALNAGAPFYNPARLFATNPEMGFVYGASIYLAIGSISVWSVRKYLTYISLIQNTPKSSKSSEITLAISSLTLGTASSLPGALITIMYSPSWLLPLSLFYDITTGTISYNEALRNLYTDRYLYRGPDGILLRNTRDQVIDRLSNGANNDGELEANADQQIVIGEFRQAFLTASGYCQLKNRHPKLFGTYLNISGQALGILLPMSWAAISIYLVFTNLKSSLGLGSIASGIIAVCTTFPSYYLEYLFGKKSVTSLYTFLAYKALGVTKVNPMFTYYPKSTTLLLFVASILVGFSFAGRAKVASDLLDEGLLRSILMWSVSIATVIFKLSAAVDNVFGLGSLFLSKVSKHSIFNRQLLFSQYITMLRMVTPDSIQSLLKTLPIDDISQSNDDSNPLSENHLLLANSAGGGSSSFFGRRNSGANISHDSDASSSPSARRT